MKKMYLAAAFAVASCLPLAALADGVVFNNELGQTIYVSINANSGIPIQSGNNAPIPYALVQKICSKFGSADNCQLIFSLNQIKYSCSSSDKDCLAAVTYNANTASVSTYQFYQSNYTADGLNNTPVTTITIHTT